MTKTKGNKNIGVIILSAGESSRMGKIKQLLLYKGKPILHHICHKLSSLDAQSILCITGHENKRIEKEVTSFNIQPLFNKDYKNGMSSSIVLGISQLIKNKKINGALIVLSDQPLIPEKHYQLLTSTFNESQSKIVATSYGGTYGVPAIFDRSLFKNLLSGKDDQGAKALIKELMDNVTLIECREATYDIDTETDYQNLIDNII